MSSAVKKHEAVESQESQPWPRGVSRDAIFSIGYVAEELQKEFPALTVSKIRFLEGEGLIVPARSSSGYRKYSQADIERLRFVLARQRDSYHPLKVIGDELLALDAGHDVEIAPIARVVASDGKVIVPQNRPYIPLRDLMDLTGAEQDSIERYVTFGLITPDIAGYFPVRSVQVVALLRRLEAEGFDARILRSVHSASDRGADLIDSMVANLRARGRSGDKERASARATDLGELLAELYREMLRTSLSRLNS